MNALLLLAALLCAQDDVRLIDVTGSVSAGWVLPEGTGKGCRLLVDTDAEPWYACRGRFLLGPTYADLRRMEPFSAVAWGGDSGVYASTGEVFGVYLSTSLRPLARFPGKTVTVSAGAGGALYITASGGGATDVYVASGSNRWKLFTTSKTVTAVGGDGKRHFVALQRRVYGLGDEGPEELFQHPDSDVSALEYDPNLGLFYATAKSAGFIGSRYESEFLIAPSPQLRLAGGSLYVSPAGGGVLKLKGLDAFGELDARLSNQP